MGPARARLTARPLFILLFGSSRVLVHESISNDEFRHSAMKRVLSNEASEDGISAGEEEERMFGGAGRGTEQRLRSRREWAGFLRAAEGP